VLCARAVGAINDGIFEPGGVMISIKYDLKQAILDAWQNQKRAAATVGESYQDEAQAPAAEELADALIKAHTM
jgi:hypothetical protein